MHHHVCPQLQKLSAKAELGMQQHGASRLEGAGHACYNITLDGKHSCFTVVGPLPPPPDFISAQSEGKLEFTIRFLNACATS